MLPGVLLVSHIKPPHPIISWNLVCELLAGQPLQYPVYSDPVNNMALVEKVFYFMVGQRTACFQQNGQYLDARQGYPCTRIADHAFSGIV